MGRSLQAVALAALLIAGCSATSVDPIQSADFVPDKDEQRLWDDAERYDKHLERWDLILADAELEEYLHSVANRLLPHLGAVSAKLRIRVVKDPFLNASALPNGTVYVHAGLLAHMENEAQLASVLGHELVHFLRRHGLTKQRTEKNRRIVSGIGIGLVALIAAAGGNAGLVLAVTQAGAQDAADSIAVQIAGYQREKEHEADSLAVAAMQAAGYPAIQSLKILEILKRDIAENGITEPYVYGSHPSVEERIANCRALASESQADGDLGTERFSHAVRRAVLESAKLDLAIGRPRRALAAVQKHLSVVPNSVEGNLLLAQVQRRFSGSDANSTAIVALQTVLRVEPENTEANREIGLLYRSTGDPVKSYVHLQKYLELAPHAADRRIIEGYLSQ